MHGVVASSQRIERGLLAVVLGFVWLGTLSLAIQTEPALPMLVGLSMTGIAVALHVWLNHFAPNRDPLLLPLALLLQGWGLLIITRVAENFTVRQLGSAAVATLVIAAVTTNRDGLRWLRRFKYTWMIGGFIVLAASLVFGVNPSGAGARLWLRIGGFFVQPSELLRLLIIAFWAAYFAEFLPARDDARLPLRTSIGQALPAIAMWLVAVGLLASQQDLGAASLLVLTFAFMLYLATGRRRVPLILIGAFLLAGLAGYFLSARVETRISIWLNPDIDPQGRSFQIVQSLIAVANGGLIGQGLNQGQPGYVPAVHTDFPFVAVAEEFGGIGAAVMISAFAVLCWRGWRIAKLSPAPYVQLLAGGIAASLAVQVAVIVGGNLALLPLTGVTLPFVSYGGSSLLVWSISLALLLRLSADETGQRPARARVNRAQTSAARITLALFGALLLGTFSIMAARGATLVSRADNPRRIDAERTLARGPILARDGSPLALSAPVGVLGGAPVYSRTYPITSTVSAVGYYSERYGVGGVEAFADRTLRGQRSGLETLLHLAQIGDPVTTTLELPMQRRLTGAMQRQKGAAIVLDLKSGAVLAMFSAPGFDPNWLDRDWDALTKNTAAPLVNRATQGLYQPGALLAWLYATTPERFAWDPTDRFDLSKPVPFELENVSVPYPASATYSETLGQGTLRVTPLRVAVAVFARHGTTITPTLLSETADATRALPGISEEMFEAVAEAGAGQFVAWAVSIDSATVTVIALEQDTASLAPVRAIQASIRAASGQ